MNAEEPGHYSKTVDDIEEKLKNACSHIEKQQIKKAARRERNKENRALTKEQLDNNNAIRLLHEKVAAEGVPTVALTGITQGHSKTAEAIENAKLYAINQVLKYNAKAYKDHLHRGLKNEYLNIDPKLYDEHLG